MTTLFFKAAQKEVKIREACVKLCYFASSTIIITNFRLSKSRITGDALV